MKLRKNIEVRVSVEIVQVSDYGRNDVLAKATRSTAGEMDIDGMIFTAQKLVEEARASALEGLAVVADRDATEESPEVSK